MLRKKRLLPYHHQKLLEVLKVLYSVQYIWCTYDHFWISFNKWINFNQELSAVIVSSTKRRRKRYLHFFSISNSIPEVISLNSEVNCIIEPCPQSEIRVIVRAICTKKNLAISRIFGLKLETEIWWSLTLFNKKWVLSTGDGLFNL